MKWVALAAAAVVSAWAGSAEAVTPLIVNNYYSINDFENGSEAVIVNIPNLGVTLSINTGGPALFEDAYARYYDQFLDYCEYSTGDSICGGDETPVDFAISFNAPFTVLPTFVINQFYPDGNLFESDFFTLLGIYADVEPTGFNATGAGYDLENIRITVIEAVPEPAEWMLLVLAFGGMGCLLRRRRQCGYGLTA
jgi:hypothetical protein